MPTDALFPLQGKRVWIAGHRGMVGRALVRRLASEDCEVLTVDRVDLDLRRQEPTERWIASARPDAIFLAAARVGGILANDTRPAEFLADNLAIQNNVIEGARRAGVGKLLFLGSSCIYPRLAPQPIAEEALLTGPLEPTNEWYAIAKIAGLKMAQAYRRQYGCDFISAMPTNLYGPGDNYDLASSHALAALVRKAHEAKLSRSRTLSIWGSGEPLREFLYVDDCADALVFLMTRYSGDGHVNVGSGDEVSIAELAELVKTTVGLKADLVHDLAKPDGAPRKRLDTTKLETLGWRRRVPLPEGLRETYRWFLEHSAEIAAT
ncbi:MAG TPA: GDP-L-fucose synthase [Caulobacteraceae bacterium]|nr:GDP-L-fucose synthase [Caulobacteraceae bacterium]